MVANIQKMCQFREIGIFSRFIITNYKMNTHTHMLWHRCLKNIEVQKIYKYKFVGKK